MSNHRPLTKTALVWSVAFGALVVTGSVLLPPGAAEQRQTRNPQLIMSTPQTMKGDSWMVVGPSAWVNRIYLDAAPGITWVRIAKGAVSSVMPERWDMVFFDGPPIFGREIVTPKTRARCEGCEKDIVQAFTVYAWGKGGSLTFRYQTFFDWEEYMIPLEGSYITDPITEYDRSIIPEKARYPEIWHHSATITINPEIVQAGRPVMITVQLPNRQRANISRVDLKLPEPIYEPGQGFFNNYRIVSLPYEPAGVYSFAWTVPPEVYARDNYFSGGGTIWFEAVANKPDPNGNFPIVETRAVNITIDGLLRISDMGIQGKAIPLGEKGEWNFNNPSTNPLSAWVRSAGGNTRGRLKFVWDINGEQFTTLGGDFPRGDQGDGFRMAMYRDQVKLLATTTITVTVSDASGNSASGTIYVGPAQIVQKQTKEMWIEPADSTINKGDSLGLRAYARLKDGRKVEITSEVTFDPSRFFRSDSGGTFTVNGTTKTYEGTIRSATVTVRPKKRIAVRIEPISQKIVVGQTATYDIVELFEDNTTQKVGTQTYTGKQPGTFTVSGNYRGTPTLNCSVVYVRQLSKMWLEPPSSRVNKGEFVNFRVKASFANEFDEDITDQSEVKPAKAFSSPKGGTFTISAASTPYPGNVQPATVVVRDKNRIGLLILPATKTVVLGETATFEIVEQYEDNTMLSVGQEKFTGSQVGTFTLIGRVNNEMTDNQAVATVVAAKPAETKPTPKVPPKTVPPPGTKPGKIDDALADILRDGTSQEDCRTANAQTMFANLNALTSQARTTYNLFMAYANKFNKEVSDRTSDICGNGIVAYCFKSVVEYGKQLDGVVPQILQLRNKIINLHGTCPPFAQDMQKLGYTINGLISATSGMGAYDDRLDGMRRRLNEAGCDENEVAQLGQRIPPPPGLDPDFLQRGGTMQEIPGDAVDNDADGFQDESLEGLAGYNVTFVLYDSGSAKDDSFNLAISKFGSLGNTPAGGQRTYGLNMPAGPYVATVTVVSAPDNVGTFTLSIFEKGTKIATLTGGPTQGSSAQLSFVVTGKH